MEVYVKTYPLPAARELVRQNDDGSYTIVVNSSLCREQQLDVVAHALGHIKNNDWTRVADGESIGVIEAEADRRKDDDIIRYVRRLDEAGGGELE